MEISSEDDGDWLNDVDSDDDDEEEGEDKDGNNNNNKVQDKKKSKKDKNKKKDEKAAGTKAPSTSLPGWGDFDDDWGTPSNNNGVLSKKQQKKLAKQQQGGKTEENAPSAAPVEEKKLAVVIEEKPAVVEKNEEPKLTQFEELAKTKLAHAYTGGFSAVTSDFPMQNVLLHCGVPTVGSNGQCIRELRVWVLRCHACAAIVHDTLKQFCPECGSGDTLKRVHYVMNDKGEKHLFVNFRHRISTRGTIFNLSKPRGGRKGTNKTLVLREDQLRSAGKVDARERFMRENRNEGDELSGFGERDSRAGRRDGNFMMERSSYTRKNTNEARKVRASRKR